MLLGSEHVFYTIAPARLSGRGNEFDEEIFATVVSCYKIKMNHDTAHTVIKAESFSE
jgi:hypothetical protein